MGDIAVGLSKGHSVTKREVAARPARRKGVQSQRIKKVRATGLRSTLVVRCTPLCIDRQPDSSFPCAQRTEPACSLVLSC